MGSTRKKISAHDYPEHLNPFSEPALTAPSEKPKIYTDRRPKNGTWSSKITKRVSRSVTWLEKSWLPTENSRKHKNQHDQMYIRNYDNDCATEHEIIEKVPLSEAIVDSNEKRDGHYQQTRERIRETVVNPNEISSTKCNQKKQEVKKKKKRPAPPPPPTSICDTCSTPTESTPPESICTYTTSEENEKMENPSANAIVIDHCDDSSERHPLREHVVEKSSSPDSKEDSPNVSRPNSSLSISNVSISRINESSTTNEENLSSEKNECKRLENNLERLEIVDSPTESESHLMEKESHMLVDSVNYSNNQDTNGDENEQITFNSTTAGNSECDENANNIRYSEIIKNERDKSTIIVDRVHCNGEALQT